MTKSPLVDSSLAVLVFSLGDDPIAYLNKAMDFITVVASLRGDNAKVILVLVTRVMLLVIRERMQVDKQGLLNITTVKVKDIWLGNSLSLSDQAMQHDPGVLNGQAAQKIIPNNAAFQTEDLDTYDSDYDDVSNAKEEFKQSPVVDFIDNEIHSDSNIILYSQYLQEAQLITVQDTTLQAQQDSMIISVIEQIKPPVKVKVPSELPKVSLVNASLKRLKFHLAQFDSVLKKRTTPNARTEDIFNVFDKNILNETTKVQTVFDQMDAVVQQSSVDKQCLEIAKKELLLENDRLLQQIMSQDVLFTVMNSRSLIGETVNIERKGNEYYDKCFKLDAELLESQNAYNDLLKSYSQLEKHFISLELSIQLNQEIFKKHESCDNQNALENPEFFKNNDLKAQLQDKDTTICKLKELLKSMREKSKEENVNYDFCEIGTKNVELENSVAKLLSENEHLCKETNHVNQVFKDQFDSIKKTRVRTTEPRDSLIDKLNLKSAENKDLRAQIQDKVFMITSLKKDLQKLKGKEIINIAAQTPSAYIIVPGMFKLDLEPLAPRLLQNKEAQIDYLKYTQEQVDILWGIVEQAKAK
nr:hypothetical protein [Tanacetum cinerariifolium]